MTKAYSTLLADPDNHIDRSNPAPAYMQLQDIIRRAVERGVLKVGDALPPERDLAEDFAVSRVTLRKALSGLAEQGILERRQGAGTFVTERVEKSFTKLSSFSEDMAARGRRPHSRWLQRIVASASPEESMALGLSPGASVYRFERIRFADDMPMAFETSTLPIFALPSVDSVEDSLYRALEQSGCRPVRALQRLRATLIDSHRAPLLGLDERDAVLSIERRGFLDDGRTVEFTRSLYRGDQYDFVAELQHAPIT